jgi:hypothetical protein
VVNETTDKFSASAEATASSSFSSLSSSVASAYATETEASTTLVSSSTVDPSPEEPEPTPLSEEEIRAKAQIIVQEDLRVWQEKFAKAADHGSEELDERIAEITDRMIENQAHGVGEALLVELEETVKSGLTSLKADIISIIKARDSEISDTELPESKLSTATRKAGSAIRDKAQAIRVWRQKYDQETNYLVSESAQNTFDILDHIRDLGLQEVGMRWAWTDGITHKDWTKYHALKGQFDEWRSDIEQIAIAHPGLSNSRAASEDIESRAMAIAEDASKELMRLKETGRWKISTADVSDDWSTKYMPAPVANVGQKVMDKVGEASKAVLGTSQGAVESISSVVSSSLTEAASTASSYIASQADNVQTIASEAHKSASSEASVISSSVLGKPQDSVGSIISIAKSSASSAADQASSSIIGTPQGTAESVASVVSASASSIIDAASSSILGTSQGSVESVLSVASDSASSLADEASSSILGTQPSVIEQASISIESAASAIPEAVHGSVVSESSKVAESASEVSNSLASEDSSTASMASDSLSSAVIVSSSAASSATESVKKVWGGAMAQRVEARQIVLDDIIEDDSEASYSEKIQSMASEAGDKFSDVTRAVSEALLKPTSTTGSVESVTSLAAEQYSKALNAASVALYGTQQGQIESVASIASGKYAEAVAA